MLDLWITPRAYGDLYEAWKHIARERPATANGIAELIHARAHNLTILPEQGRLRPEIGVGIRSLVVERWLLLYRISGETIVVLRIVDGARELTYIDLGEG